jgi:hypothetical protein
LADQKLAAVLGDDLTAFSNVERLVIELADAMAATPRTYPMTFTRVCASNFLKSSYWNWELRSPLRTFERA